MIVTLGAGLWTDPRGQALIAMLVDGGFDAATLNLIVNAGASLQDLQNLLDQKIDGITLLSQLTHSTTTASATAASQASAQLFDAQKAADAAEAAKSLAAGQPVPDSITLQVARGVYAQPANAAVTSAAASRIATNTMKAGGSFDDAVAAAAAATPAAVAAAAAQPAESSSATSSTQIPIVVILAVGLVLLMGSGERKPRRQ